MEVAGVLTAVLGLGFLLSSTLSLLPTIPHFSPSCPLRLTHLLFFTSLLFWLIFQFTALLLLSPLSCNVLSILTSFFDQLSRFLLLTLLLFAVRPPPLATSEKAIVYVLIALRFILGATVAGFTRSAFIPVCFPEAEHREHGRSAGVTVLAFDGMIMVVTVLRAVGVWRGARKVAGNVGGKQELGLLGVTIAGWGWAVAAVPGQLRVGSIFLRLFPGSVMLAILLELLKRFPNSFFLLQQQSEISLRVAGMGSGSVSDSRLQRFDSDASEVRSFPRAGSRRDLESRDPTSWTIPPSHNSISHPNLIETHHPSHAGGRPNISGPMLTNGVLISQNSGNGGRDIRTVSLGTAINRERERVDATLLQEEEERYKHSSRTGLSISETTGTPRTIASFAGLLEHGIPPIPGVKGVKYAESISTQSITTVSSRPSRTPGSNSSQRPSIPRVPVPGSVAIPEMGMSVPRPPMVAALPPDLEGIGHDKQYRNTYSTESSGRYTMSQAGFALAPPPPPPPPPSQGFAANRNIPGMPLGPDDPRMAEQMNGDLRMAPGEQRVLLLNRISYDDPALIRSIESNGALKVAARATGFDAQTTGVLRRSPGGSRNHSPKAQSDTEQESPVLPSVSFSHDLQSSEVLQPPEVPKGRLTPIIHRKHPSGTFSQRDSERVLFPRDIEFPSPPRNRPKSAKSLKLTTATITSQSDEPLPTISASSTDKMRQRKAVPDPIRVLPVRKSSLAVNPPPQSAFNGGMGMVALRQDKSPMAPYETAKALMNSMSLETETEVPKTHGRKGSASSTTLPSSSMTTRSKDITLCIEMETLNLATGSTLDNSAATEDIHITLARERKSSNSSSQAVPSLSRTTESPLSNHTFPTPQDQDTDSYKDGDEMQLFNLSPSSTSETIILSALSSAIELEALQSSLPPFQGTYQPTSSSQFLSPGSSSFGVSASRQTPHPLKHHWIGDPIPTFTSKSRGYGRRKQPPAPLRMVPLRDQRPPPPPPPPPILAHASKNSKTIPSTLVTAGGVQMHREKRVSEESLPKIIEPPLDNQQITPSDKPSVIPISPIHVSNPNRPAINTHQHQHRDSLLQYLEAETSRLETQWKGMRKTLLMNRDSLFSIDSGLGFGDVRGIDTITTIGSEGSEEDGNDYRLSKLSAAEEEKEEYPRDEIISRGMGKIKNKNNFDHLLGSGDEDGDGDGDLKPWKFDEDEHQDEDDDEDGLQEEMTVSSSSASRGIRNTKTPSRSPSPSPSPSSTPHPQPQHPDIPTDNPTPLPATVYINMAPLSSAVPVPVTSPSSLLSPPSTPSSTPPPSPRGPKNLTIPQEKSEPEPMVSAAVSVAVAGELTRPVVHDNQSIAKEAVKVTSTISAPDIRKSYGLWKPPPRATATNTPSSSRPGLWSPPSYPSSLSTAQWKARRTSALPPAAIDTRPSRRKLEVGLDVLKSDKLWEKKEPRSVIGKVNLGNKMAGLWRGKDADVKSTGDEVGQNGGENGVGDEDEAGTVQVLKDKIGEVSGMGEGEKGAIVPTTLIPSYPRNRPAATVDLHYVNPRVKPRVVNRDNFPAVPVGVSISASLVIQSHTSGPSPIPAINGTHQHPTGTTSPHLEVSDTVLYRALPTLQAAVTIHRGKSYLWQQPPKSQQPRNLARVRLVEGGGRKRLWPDAEDLKVDINKKRYMTTKGRRIGVRHEGSDVDGIGFGARSTGLWRKNGGVKLGLWKKAEKPGMLALLWPDRRLGFEGKKTSLSLLWQFTKAPASLKGSNNITARNLAITALPTKRRAPSRARLADRADRADRADIADNASLTSAVPDTQSQSESLAHGTALWKAAERFEKVACGAKGMGLWQQQFRHSVSMVTPLPLQYQSGSSPQQVQEAREAVELEHVGVVHIHHSFGDSQQFQAQLKEVQQFCKVQNAALKRRARSVEMMRVDEEMLQKRFVSIRVAGRVFCSETPKTRQTPITPETPLTPLNSLRSSSPDLSAIPTNFMGSLVMTESALRTESESLRSGCDSNNGKHLWMPGASAKSSSASSTKLKLSSSQKPSSSSSSLSSLSSHVNSNSSKSIESPSYQTLWTLSSSDANAPGFLFSSFTSSNHTSNPVHRPKPVISAEDMPKPESLWTLDHINHNHNQSNPKPQLWKSNRSISVKGLWKDAPLLVDLQEYHAGGKLWRKTAVKPIQDRKAASELSSKTSQAQMLAPSKPKKARFLQPPLSLSAVNKPITRSTGLTRLTKRAEVQVQVHGGLWQREPRHVEAERTWMQCVIVSAAAAAQESGKIDSIQKEHKKNNSEIHKDSSNSEYPSPAILEKSKQQSNRILIKFNISSEINPAHVQPEVKEVARRPGLKGRLWTASATATAAAAAAVSPPIERVNADYNQESSKILMPPPPESWIRETASRPIEGKPEQGATAQRNTSSTVTPASDSMWENRNIVVRKGRVVVSADQLWNAPEPASQQPSRPVFRQTNKRIVVATEDTRALWATSAPAIATPPCDTTTKTTTTTTTTTTTSPISSAPLWTPEAASRTTTATPERTITAPRKQSIDLPKATGSLWTLQLPEDIVVKKGKVVVSGSGSDGLWTHDEESHAPHTLRRTTSSITVRGIEMTDAKDDVEKVEVKVAGRLWTASLKRPQSPAPPTDQPAPLWAKHTAKRTTTAVPERGIVVPRKTTAELPKATGSLWEGRSVVVKKGKVVVDSALWDGSDIATEAAPVLRHSKSSRTLIAMQDEDNHPKIEVQVAGRLWVAETPKQPEIPAVQLNAPLWSSATASRTTDASPAHIPASQKKVTPTSESLTVPKAEGSLWDGRDIIVRKGKVVVNSSMSLWSHNEAAARPALRRSTSSITVIPVEKEEVQAAIEVKVAGRLWTARVEPPAPKITTPPSPLWSKETAKRTTTAVPERVVTAPRKMSVDLPKATGSLWSGRDVVVKKGKVVVTPASHPPALWGNTCRPVLRRQKSSVTVIPVEVPPVEPKKLEISVAGRLWTAAVPPPVIVHPPVPLWAPHTASRTTTAVPERVKTAPRKVAHPPKATGSLWKPQDIVVKKHSVVVNPVALWTKPVEEHAPVIRKSRSRITLTPLVIDTPVQQVATVKVAGRLWTAPIPAAPVAVSEPKSPLWAASTASRTTSAVPERVQTAPRKAPIDLPKATGSLWQNRQITIRKGRVIVSEELVNSHLKPVLEHQPAVLRRQSSSRTIVALSEDSTPAPAPLRVAGRIITSSRAPSRAVSRASSPQRRPSLWTPTSPASSDPRDVIPANYNVTVAHNKIHLLTSSSTSTEFGDYHAERATPPAPLNLKETLWSPPASPVRLASPILPSFTWSKHTASRTTTQLPVKGVIVAKKMRGGNAVQVATGALWNETQEQENRQVVRRAKSSRTLRAVSGEESEQQEPQFAISVGGRIMTAQVPRRMRTPSPTLGQPASISPGSTISDSSIEEGDQQDGHKVQVVRINSGSHNALWTPRVVVAQRSLEELAEEKRQAEELEEMERLKRVRDAERVMREENEKLEVEEKRLERRRSMEFIKAKEKELEEKNRREREESEERKKSSGEGASKTEAEKKSTGGFLQSVIGNRKEKKGGWYGGLGLF